MIARVEGNAMDNQAQRQQFLEKLPWYVNGTLPPDERKWVDHYLIEHPEDAHEVQWDRGFRALSQTVPLDIGWEKCLANISKLPKKRSFLSSMSDMLMGHRQGHGAWPLVSTACLLIILLQSAFIAKQILDKNDSNEEFARYRDLRIQAEGPVIQVRFKEKTQERDIRMLLLGINGSVISGPNQLGDYLIRIPSKDTSSALNQLTSSAIVEIADVLPDRR